MAYTDPARGSVKRRADDLNEARSAKKRKLDASIVVPYDAAFDGTDTFKLDFYKAVEHFGMYAIVNWVDTASAEPHASMLHAAIMASNYENLWAVHQLIDMGADVERRGRVWFLGFDLSPLELCAFLLGFDLRGYLKADLVGYPHLRKDVDEIVVEYCKAIEHLTAFRGNALAVNWVLEGLFHPRDRTGRPARRGEAYPDESAWAVRDHDPMEGSPEALLVKHILKNTSFREAFELEPVWQGGPSGLDYPSYGAEARAAARHKREVESEVAAAMKKTREGNAMS